MAKGIIYSITCPKHNKVFYVGQTLDLNRRINAHFRNRAEGNTVCELYMKKLKAEGLKPIFSIHRKCDECDLNAHESELIKEFINKGFLLLNQRKNNRENYDGACEFYLDIKNSFENEFAEIIDLTLDN